MLAHATHMTDEEFRRVAAAGSAIVHCPLSNVFFGDGILRLRDALRYCQLLLSLLYRFFFCGTTVYCSFFCFRLYFIGRCGLVSIILFYFRIYYDIVLHCIVLYCTVLYCTVLYCMALYCTVLQLYRTVLHCIKLYQTVSNCTVLYRTVLYCIGALC